MISDEHRPPGLLALANRLVSTGAGALQNRAELLLLEWQQERTRLSELLVRGLGLVFFSLSAVMLLTATIILACPERARIYVAGGFTLLYVLGAFWAWTTMKNLLKRDPFPETLNQLQKDRHWLDSLK